MKLMKLLRIFTASIAICAMICTSCNTKPADPVKPDPTPTPTPDPEPEPTPVRKALSLYEALTISGDNSSASSQNRWIDFQTGELYASTGNDPANKHAAAIDAGLFMDATGFRFASPAGSSVDLSVDSPSGWSTKLRTRFHTISSADMDATKFASIKKRSELLAVTIDGKNITSVLGSSALSPFQTDYIKDTPMYIGFKTYTAEENNNYGIMEVKSIGATSITVNILVSDNSGSEYTEGKVVTIKGNRLYVDGKEFYVNGAAATMKHELMADYGANTCRIYGGNISSAALLDKVHEKGLMMYMGLSCPQYSSEKADFDNATWRRQQIATMMETVKQFKNHPAILCWSLGNELEVDGNKLKESIWIFYRDLNKAIKAEDPNHPTTFAVTESQTKDKYDLILKFCPDIDFLSINSYKGNLSSVESKMNSLGWTKPYMVTEYGPTGTWTRTNLSDRINSWASLIELTSEQAAQDYVDCYNTVKSFKNCLGGIAFWWGYQTHGEVLGWYPLFTKDEYMLTGIDALANCWKGTDNPLTGPLVERWDTSIKLNGKTAGEVHDPIVTAGSTCSASVTATSRNGNPLKYKWFYYKDNTYRIGSTPMTAAVDVAHYNLSDGSMDEDANKDKFVDRTLPEVSFTAPTEAGNYRLHVVVYEPISKKASTACINFQVKAN